MEYYGAFYTTDGVSDRLKVTLTNSAYSVTGYVSQGAVMNLAQAWEAPFSGMSMGSVAGVAGDLAQVGTGTTSVKRWNSLMVWQGGQPPTITLPMLFLAQNDAFTEVTGAIAALMAMASPELSEDSVAGRIPEPVTLNLGRRINLIDVRIQDVSWDLDAPKTSEGHFVRNTVNLQLCGSSLYNASDITGIFQ